MPFNNIHPYLRNLSFGKGREKKSNTKFFEKKVLRNYGEFTLLKKSRDFSIYKLIHIFIILRFWVNM